MFSRNSIYHSPVMGLFPHISMATMTTFPGTSLIVKKTTDLNRREKSPWVVLRRYRHKFEC